MTQLEKFKSLMNEFGVIFEERLDSRGYIAISITDYNRETGEENPKVNNDKEGYSYFGSTHYFYKNGNFKSVGFWE